MRLLITRPRTDAEPLADALRAHGIDSLIEPLLTVVPLPGSPLDLTGVQAFLATSANGIRAFAMRQPQRDLPVLAVGDATARTARSLGFGDVASAGGNVDSLALLVRRSCDPAAGRLLHVAGSSVAGDLAKTLALGGFAVQRAVLYATRPAEALSPEVIEALHDNRLDGAVLYSPRTARTLALLIETAGMADSCRQLTAFCLSEAVGAGVRRLPWRRIALAATPDQPALIAVILAAAGRT